MERFIHYEVLTSRSTTLEARHNRFTRDFTSIKSTMTVSAKNVATVFLVSKSSKLVIATSN